MIGVLEDVRFRLGIFRVFEEMPYLDIPLAFIVNIIQTVVAFLT